jgi:hypothetical protein
MTQNAAEIFTMQLARAAAKTANKFLHARGLQKSDRDDVIAAAMLWCWENRDNYSLTTTLETWFMNAVRDSYKNLQRNELPAYDESIHKLNNGDETYDKVAAESSAEALMRALTPADRKIAELTMQGYTKEEMMAKGVSHKAIQNGRARIKQLRRLLPDDDSRLRSRLRAGVTKKAPSLDELDEMDEAQPSRIDVEIAQLDFAPPAGKDCPPCWRCMWFEGFMPAAKRDTRMDIEDLEVREAVRVTESRKIEIAQQVRDGL